MTTPETAAHLALAPGVPRSALTWELIGRHPARQRASVLAPRSVLLVNEIVSAELVLPAGSPGGPPDTRELAQRDRLLTVTTHSRRVIWAQAASRNTATIQAYR